jgi:hypothetical protein
MIFTFKFAPNYDHYETKKIKFLTLFIIQAKFRNRLIFNRCE